jgi:hypothetical protein
MSASAGSDDPAAGSGSGANLPSAQELCAVLKTTLPRLAGNGQAENQAALTIAFSSLFDRHHALPQMRGADIDTLAQSCPAARSKAYRAAGVTTFSSL